MTALLAVNLADLDPETLDRLSRCSVSKAQEDFGGTFAEPIDTWRTADPEWVGPHAASLHGLKIAT